ncbi:TetR/AcrR family transcriptional regulator [Rhabdothermincola salaria]|uniref:TetR/AcrR family transcriptional regulator n=1 Tax=Rhabdothermincola salaria TaxID=2903142 RepID=UPI001E4050F9|nr:TetR/AcrR family transcriptional regulator [Rhabdothermincola salaria]MCD9622860.1 TetR/AcrR family transcriptional regulator [Rhabdothermincola salaria]
MMSLYSDGQYTPTAAAIAERAGVSVRSLFRYFDDVEDLAAAVIERQASLVYPLLAVDVAADDPVEVRVAQLVDGRVRQYELLAPAARAARAVAHRRPLVAAKLAEINAARREQIRTLFSEELEAMGPHDARRVLGAADVLCSFETYHLLREEHGLEPDVLVADLARTLLVLLRRDRD